MTTKVAYAVQQDPPKPKSCDGNNGQKWTAVEKKKSMDESVPLIGRPYGGCSIIWSSNTSCKVGRIECISKRLCAVKVTVDGIEFVLFNMYMPCDKGYANHDLFEYIDVLNEVSVFVTKLHHNILYWVVTLAQT